MKDKIDSKNELISDTAKTVSDKIIDFSKPVGPDPNKPPLEYDEL